MVSGGVWHEEPSERAEVARLLGSYGIEPTEALLCFQEQFGGLEYQIRGRPEGWRFGLVGNGVDYLIDSQFAKALDHRTEQLSFAMHYLSGEIFVNDYSGWIPIASSAGMLIESDAMIDELGDAWKTGVYVMLGYYAREDFSFNEALLHIGLDFVTVSEASDKHTTWWVSKRFRIIRKALYYSPLPLDCIELYARDVTEARQLAAAFIEQGVLKQGAKISCFPHPFDPAPVYQGRP